MKNLKTFQIILICLSAYLLIHACQQAKVSEESEIPLFEIKPLFETERFPNIVISTKGTLIASYGNDIYKTRRSTDGGITWEEEVIVSHNGFSGGGLTVDENTGDILAWTEDGHPPSPFRLWRSSDDGKTWQEESTKVFPDSKGNVPAMHMNERGITLQFGPYKGRLIRPTRVYAGGNDPSFWDEHYVNAIFSDDGGKTWQTSEPFPIMGTGEACLEQLSDGRIYYNSRRHKSTDGQDPRWRYIGWSDDGGVTWKDISISNELPDGNQNSDYGLMAGLTRIPDEQKDILLFSNIDVPKKDGQKDLEFENRWGERYNGTVWISLDGGQSWPVKKLVEPKGFGYSSLVAGRPGTVTENRIYLLYERIENGKYGGGNLAIFNKKWLLDN